MPVPVFYTPKMVADSLSFSPSAKKPVHVVESWKSKFDIEIIEPTPVTLDEIARAHDRTWAEGVLAGLCTNGFGNRDLKIAASLPYTSGALLSAARHALKTGKVAAAPCSGFHHAEHASAQGFCTFNGLMVTALALKAEGLVKTIGILDLDMHYGNGTDDIIGREYAAGALTNQPRWITHFTGGQFYNFPNQAEEFITEGLPEVLATMMWCDLVLYQAGADPHIDDPHGGWLTTDQLRMRDELVFTALSKLGKPVAWNLAGGYQIEKDGSIPKVLEIHDNTMRECVKAWGG